MKAGNPTPVKLQDWLFAWEIIASFSTPRTACILESVCRDIHDILADSSTGSSLMQRYWNLQYHRLLWDEAQIDAPRRTLDFSLSRSERKKNWKKMYRDEYPLWVSRTFRGVGATNNAMNEARALFKVERANPILSGAELAKLETTGGRGAEKSAPVKVAGLKLNREDYHDNRRLSKHKEKHKKGRSKWGIGHLEDDEEW